MSIVYENGVFKLDTPHTSYVMTLADGKWLCQLYYGARLETTDLGWALESVMPETPEGLPRDAVDIFDTYPAEFGFAGMGDFREPCLAVETAAGQLDCLPVYAGYEITPGKPPLPDLPATFGESCDTLRVTLRDEAVGVRVELLYTAFRDVDAIARSARIVCEGSAPVTLRRALSVCLHMPYEPGMELLTLHGAWGRERAIQREPIGLGLQGVGSRRGKSSHQANPFMAILTGGTTQETGEVRAVSLVYSGSFTAQVERSQFDTLRAVAGIHPDCFAWRLMPGESFQTPEAVLVYSAAGLGPMTRTFHDLWREHLLRGPYVKAPRPVLLNNWEGTYFHFNEERLLAMAARARELGVDLFVLDDGWFGHRDDDNSSLGDWDKVNTPKLPHGLSGLAERINALGMRFGVWMEPEMVSEDSDLCRAHPDWVIRTASRAPAKGRNQMLLDLSRPEVEEYIWRVVSGVLHSASISYLKWDMNRPLADAGSAALLPERQGELHHRRMLAVYRLQERLIREFPDLLLENCSAGGARFDPGMLHYSPQIWTSDNSDAIARLSIQEGTSLVYPLSTMGAHVSVCPNHAVGRVTPFATRAAVASLGTFGYELDVTKLSEEDQAQIPGQIARYKSLQALVETGDYYRLASASEGTLDAQLVVSKDCAKALVTVVRTLCVANTRPRPVRLRGLDPRGRYRVEDTDAVYPGDALMQFGLPVELPWGDFTAKQVLLTRI